MTSAPPTYPALVARLRRAFTDAETAELVGTSACSVQAWAAGSANPRPAHRDALLRLAAVLDALAEVYADAGAKLWLFSPRNAWKYRSPFDLLSRGRYAEVHALIDTLAGGPRTQPGPWLARGSVDPLNLPEPRGADACQESSPDGYDCTRGDRHPLPHVASSAPANSSDAQVVTSWLTLAGDEVAIRYLDENTATITKPGRRCAMCGRYAHPPLPGTDGHGRLKRIGATHPTQLARYSAAVREGRAYRAALEQSAPPPAPDTEESPVTDLHHPEPGMTYVQIEPDGDTVQLAISTVLPGEDEEDGVVTVIAAALTPAEAREHAAELRGAADVATREARRRR